MRGLTVRAGREDLFLVHGSRELFWLDVATRETRPIVRIEECRLGFDTSGDGRQQLIA